MKNVWTSEELLADITNQMEKQQKNYREDLSNLIHQNIVAITALKKYACPESWEKQGKSKSIYKGCGIKKAQAALQTMRKIRKDKGE